MHEGSTAPEAIPASANLFRERHFFVDSRATWKRLYLIYS
jgi:hypothetical protein